MRFLGWFRNREAPRPITNIYDVPQSMIDHLRETEAMMTHEQKLRAFAIARENGWINGANPPPYCWAAFFRQAMEELPCYKHEITLPTISHTTH